MRAILLDESDEGQRLRQTDLFCGILTPAERWQIYREAKERSLREWNAGVSPAERAASRRHRRIEGRPSAAE